MCENEEKLLDDYFAKIDADEFVPKTELEGVLPIVKRMRVHDSEYDALARAIEWKIYDRNYTREAFESTYPPQQKAG